MCESAELYVIVEGSRRRFGLVPELGQNSHTHWLYVSFPIILKWLHEPHFTIFTLL